MVDPHLRMIRRVFWAEQVVAQRRFRDQYRDGMFYNDAERVRFYIASEQFSATETTSHGLEPNLALYRDSVGLGSTTAAAARSRSSHAAPRPQRPPRPSRRVRGDKS